MDLDHADAKAEVVFDGTSIIIRPKAAEDILLFQSQALKAGHEVVRYEYFDQETLCSTILCDFTEKILRVKNHTDQILKLLSGDRKDQHGMISLNFWRKDAFRKAGKISIFF